MASTNKLDDNSQREVSFEFGGEEIMALGFLLNQALFHGIENA